MATYLRFSINCLYKQLVRLRLHNSQDSDVGATVLGSIISRRSKFSGSRNRFRRGTKMSSVALEKEWGEESTVFEEVEDQFLELGLERHLDTDRELRQDRLHTKMAIIRKKYFKPVQELSLLTWEATEQIRFLHNTMPDIWSVEKLAQSFPCSEVGIKKILHSSYQPRTESEIQRFNKRARKNWAILKASLKNKGDVADAAAFQHLLEENKLALLINAGGITDLPSLPKSECKDKKLTKRVGMFESIIKNYQDEVSEKVKPVLLGKSDKSVEVSDREQLLSIVQMDKYGKHYKTPSLPSASTENSEYSDSHRTVDVKTRNLTEVIFNKEATNQIPVLRKQYGRKRRK